MGSFISARSNLARNLVRRFAAGKAVLQKPLAETRAQQAAKLLRFHVRGIRDQFTAQAEMRGAGTTAWAKSKPFGTKKAPNRTMQGSGDYRRAWLGGAGSTETVSANSVTIGVEREIFPQVSIHQGPRTSTTVFPKRRTKGGRDWKMRLFLGMTYGVWMSKARIEKGLKILRRRLSVSNDVKKAIALMVKNETRKAMGAKTLRVAR